MNNRRSKIEADLRQSLRTHHGIITLREALELGASRGLIRNKLENNTWVRMYRGVYRDTTVPRSPYQDLRAAFVATHGRGVVSHSSAGWLWDLIPAAPTRPELTVPFLDGGSAYPRGLAQHVAVHRSRDIDIAKAVLRRDVLVTNPMRTIVDVAATLPPDQLDNATDRALAARLFTIPALVAELDRLARRGRPGVGALRRSLKDRGFIGAPAPSVLESKMLRLIVAAGLPLPKVELTVGLEGEYRLDFAWPDLLLTVEVDGYVWHFSPEHQQRDHARRNHIQDLGWAHHVYTWREVNDEPGRVSRQIRASYYTRLSAKSSTI